ncbi:fibronectin type III domain-containing protein, partial [Flavobacteriales bacterium]|nr:fibronectin type III domain-containing protein [Flavobacteriales bacterium]
LTGTGTNYGMYLYRAHGSATNKSEIQNNMISTSPSSTATTYGVYLGYGQHINFYHNSINCTGGSATGGRGIYVLGSTSTLYGDVDIKNNVFANSGLGVAAYVNSGATTGFLTGMDYNIYTASSGNILSLNGANNTLAAWTTATGLDSNSINAVPGFISSTDLHLQGGVAADAGANVGVMVDIDGDARPILPSTGYDIGADEYIPPTCPVGYGTTSFNLTATSGDITWIPGANDTGWIVEYGPTGYTAGAGTSSQPSNDTTTISGLTPVTTYDVYIKGICGIGDTSLWMGPYTFTTRCVSSLNGLYTIDNTIPTGGINYNSFADAMNALNICGVSGPTTFHVNQGTYTEQVNLTSIIGSTPLNTVTFKADPTNTSAAIITYSANVTANNYVLRFDGVENVVWDSLTINPTGATYAYGAYFPTTANNITIKNCEFNGNTNSTSSLAAVIYNQSGAANLTNNVTLDNNVINGGSYGVYWWGGGTTTKENNLTFTNNKVLGFRSYGTYFYYQDTVTIEDNLIKQAAGSTSFGYAILSYYIDNSTVKRNDIEMTSTSTNYGIMVGRYAGTSNEVSNNMIVLSANQTATGSAYGMYVNYALNTKIYHNSIHVRSGSPTNTRALYLTGSTSTLYGNVDIRNNIFVNSAGGFALDATAGASNTTFLSHLDYNVYSSSGTTPFRYNNQTYANLTLHQAGSLLDSNSLYGNPGFVAGDDLHLLGAIAYDNGDATLGIMDDIDGDVRPLSPSTGYDIGADEYMIPSCPSPYSIQAGTSGTTNINVTWTNGPNDVSWELQYGPAGFTLGTGTIVSSTTNPVNVTGLTPSTCYQFWVRSICSVGDTSVWQGPTTICTDCAPLPDYCTDFESASVGSLPLCWTSFINTTATAAYIQTYGFNANSGTNCVRMYNATDANATMMLIAPEVSTLSVGTHRANFWMRGDTTVTIGTMTNPTNPGTFTPFQTLQGLNTGSYTNFKVDFTGYTGTDTYIAFLWAPGATYDNVYIDDFCWEVLPSCEKAPVVTVLNPGQDSTTLRVGWNLDTSQTSFITAYGPSGYDPITNTAGGDTVTTPFNLQIVTGLKSLTEYCFWVKAICTNGDTSAWSGPHCGSTGCPSSVAIPYFEDFSSYTNTETPLCWQEAVGALSSSASGGAINYASSLWTPDGFGNVGTTGSAKMNIWSTNRFEWIVSPGVNLGTDPNKTYYVEFDIAMTDYANTTTGVVGVDDTLAFVISYDNGNTWSKSNILQQWDTGNVPSNTGDHIKYLLRNKTGIVKFGFYATTTISNEDNDWFIDNFSIKDTVFVGLPELADVNSFKVFPNPNTGEFNIQNIGDAQQSSVKLMDIQGRVVYESQYYFNENGMKQIKVGKLNAGVYLLLLQSDGKLEQHRIVIQ